MSNASGKSTNLASSSSTPAQVDENLEEKRLGIRLSPPPGKFAIEIVFELAGLIAAVAFGVYAIRSVNIANKANQYSSQAILQALTSNQLALLAVCLATGDTNEDIASICARVIDGAATAVPSAASLLFSPLPYVTPTTIAAPVTTTSYGVSTETLSTIVNGSLVLTTFTTTSRGTASATANSTMTLAPSNSASQSGGSKSGVIAGIVAGSVGGLIVLAVGVWLLRRRNTRTRKRSARSHTPGRLGGPQAPPGPTLGQPGSLKRQSVASRFRDIFLDSKVTKVE